MADTKGSDETDGSTFKDATSFRGWEGTSMFRYTGAYIKTWIKSWITKADVGLSAAVTGPSSVTDGNPAVFDGTTGNLVNEITFAAFKTALSLAKSDVGLGSVDNTSDAAKPISTAQAAGLLANGPITISGTVGYGFGYSRTVAGTASMAKLVDGPDAANGNSYLFGIDPSGALTGFSGAVITTGKNGTGTAYPIKIANYDDKPVQFYTNHVARWRVGASDTVSGALHPESDNTYSLGTSSYRASVIYAGTGTINTSDATTKTIQGAPDDKMLDAWGAVSPLLYKFNDAIAAKGPGARTHVGWTAQSVADALLNAGLDPASFALWCSDNIHTIKRTPRIEAMAIETGQTDKDGKPVTTTREVTVEDETIVPIGTRLGLRYDECLVLEAAYQRRRADRIEARLSALEMRSK
ncbi:MAG: tail fiber domain-containing protein [Rhizobiales bacterium]|nr:tail fiber domain-containing protein [Hyphomicrobiales bacterium]